MITQEMWIIVSFICGTIFGAAMVVTILTMLIDETPLTITGKNETEWKYE